MCWSNTTILSLPAAFIVLLSSFSGNSVFFSLTKWKVPTSLLFLKSGIFRCAACLSSVSKASSVLRFYLVSISAGLAFTNTGQSLYTRLSRLFSVRSLFNNVNHWSSYCTACDTWYFNWRLHKFSEFWLIHFEQNIFYFPIISYYRKNWFQTFSLCNICNSRTDHGRALVKSSLKRLKRQHPVEREWFVHVHFSPVY